MQLSSTDSAVAKYLAKSKSIDTYPRYVFRNKDLSKNNYGRSDLINKISSLLIDKKRNVNVWKEAGGGKSYLLSLIFYHLSKENFFDNIIYFSIIREINCSEKGFVDFLITELIDADKPKSSDKGIKLLSDHILTGNNEPILFIIDNVEEAESFKILFTILKNIESNGNQEFYFLVGSRVSNLDIDGICVETMTNIECSDLPEEYLKDLFKKSSGLKSEDVKDGDLLIFFNALGKNVLLIDLFAKVIKKTDDFEDKHKIIRDIITQESITAKEIEEYDFEITFKKNIQELENKSFSDHLIDLLDINNYDNDLKQFCFLLTLLTPNINYIINKEIAPFLELHKKAPLISRQLSEKGIINISNMSLSIHAIYHSVLTAYFIKYQNENFETIFKVIETLNKRIKPFAEDIKNLGVNSFVTTNHLFKGISLFIPMISENKDLSDFHKKQIFCIIYNITSLLGERTNKEIYFDDLKKNFLDIIKVFENKIKIKDNLLDVLSLKTKIKCINKNYLDSEYKTNNEKTEYQKLELLIEKADIKFRENNIWVNNMEYYELIFNILSIYIVICMRLRVEKYLKECYNNYNKIFKLQSIFEKNRKFINDNTVVNNFIFSFAVVYSNYSYLLKDQGQMGSALFYTNKSIKNRIKIQSDTDNGHNFQLSVGFTNFSHRLSCVMLPTFLETSMKYAHKGLKLKKDKGKYPNTFRVSFSRLAINCLLLNRYEEANEYIKKAIEKASSTTISDKKRKAYYLLACFISFNSNNKVNYNIYKNELPKVGDLKLDDIKIEKDENFFESLVDKFNNGNFDLKDNDFLEYNESSFKRLEAIYYDFTKNFEFRTYFTPENAIEEKEKFKSAWEKTTIYNPIFRYLETDYTSFLDVLTLFKDEFDNFEIKNVGEDIKFLAKVYASDVKRLIERISILSGKYNDDERARYFSKEFGHPNEETIKRANEILHSSKNVSEKINNPKDYTAIDIKYKFEDVLKKNNIKSWQIELSESAIARVSVKASLKRITIKSDAKFSENDINKLIVHEIETHVFRSENGNMQPYKIFSYGFENYIETEEGLAIYNELTNGYRQAEHNINIALHAILAYLSKEKPFHALFMEAHKVWKDFDKAYNQALRIKRGMIDTSKPGGYTKDYKYLQGLVSIENLSKEKRNRLYIGKVGLGDFDKFPEVLKGKIVLDRLHLPESYNL